MRNQNLVSNIVVVTALMSFSAAAENLRVPADFGTGEDSLDKNIVFPKVSGNVDKTFLCQGILKGGGKLKSPACYLIGPGDDRYIAAIIKAATMSRFRPAQYNGKEVSVYFQFRVQFFREGEDEKINLMANQGYLENAEAYGEEYIAAQRVVTRDLWEKVCPRNAHFVVITRSHIAEDGTQSSSSVENGRGINIGKKCRQGIIETLEKSIFLPAMADGEPVESSYIEAFGS